MSRSTAAIIVGLMAVAVLATLSPHLIFTTATPTGGDMGAHVLAPALLRDSLIPSGRLMGWSNAWYAGFPLYYFYFPLPSLTIVGLDLAIPYEVAFKIVTVVGLIGLTPAAYYLARSLRLPRQVAVVAAAAGPTFVFFESFNIYGGNIASTMAGEFSYSWSFALSLVFLGALIRSIRDSGRYVVTAGVALALTALSHVLTVLVVVLAALTVGGWRGGVKRYVQVSFLGFALAGFWALPLVTRIGLTSDMAFIPLRSWRELLPVELWLLLPLALLGAVWMVRRTPRITPILTMTLIPAIYYWLPTLLPKYLPDVFAGSQWKLWNGRLLPYWYFGVAFLALVGVGLLVSRLASSLPASTSIWIPRALGASAAVGLGLIVNRVPGAPSWTPWLVGLGVAAIVVAFGNRHVVTSVLVSSATAVLISGAALAGLSFVHYWASGNFSGYENREAWDEYRALLDTIEELEPGRVHWEAHSDLGRFGTPLSLMLIPYWDPDHPSMEGLFFESSLTTPFHFLTTSELSTSPSNPIPGLSYRGFDLDRALAHLDVYGVRYYVALTDEAKAAADAHPQYTEVARSGVFTVYELPEFDLVEPASFEPRVFAGERPGFLSRLTGNTAPKGFNDFALDWYDDVTRLDRWAASEGPWPEVSSVAEIGLGVPVHGGEVSNVLLDDHRISFRTTAIGVPHMIRVSYFPNWTATGAEGPYRAAPSLMIVVPTERDVVLEFEAKWPERTGAVLSLAGILIVLGLAVRRKGSS